MQTSYQSYADYSEKSKEMIRRETRDLLAQLDAQSLTDEDKRELKKEIINELLNSL